MKGLIERVEAATGPDRRIDGDIAAALNLQPEWATKRSETQGELFSDGGPGLHARTWLAPKFTASLDAAMTLVGDKHDFGCGTDGKIDDGPKAWAWVSDRWSFEIVRATTPALALCAAAPKTRGEIIEAWRAVLPGMARKIFDEVIRGGNGSYGDVAARIDRQPVGAQWNAAISQLRANGLIVDEPGQVILIDLLPGEDA